MTVPGKTGQTSIRWPGILLGLGLGGFIDGIVLHQILQWHHMVSNVAGYAPTTVAGLQVNTLWDGLFHVVSWILVVAGLVLLWRVLHGANRAWHPKTFLGWIVMGWGIFNLVEGMLNHHILQLHHVRSGPYQMVYDLGFLLLGAFLVWLGLRTARSGERIIRGARE